MSGLRCRRVRIQGRSWFLAEHALNIVMALEVKLRSFERERFRSFWALKKERAVALTAAFQSASLSAGVPGLLHLSLTARAKPGVKAI
jgi:hypothetical protein